VISDETAPYPRKSSFLAAPAPKWNFGRDLKSFPHFAQERFKNGFY